jgi:regulator of RNase E activity RraA
MKNREKLIADFLSLDTATLSDALDSLNISGGLIGIRSQVPGTKCVGLAYTVKYGPVEKGEFKNAANYMDEVPAGSVIVVDNQGKNSCTTWGNILTQFALKKGIAGTVIYGAARDVHEIRELKYPLFSQHVFMQSGKNRVMKIDEQCVLEIEGVAIHPGDLLVCDDNGCVVIPLDLAPEILMRANAIRQTEEKILKAVMTMGMPLAAARQKFGYAEPWKRPEGEK